MVYMPVPSPYAYVRNMDGKIKDEVEREDEPWHWNTKQRKMMKAEVSDAFRMRKRVLFVLGVLMVGACMGVYMVGSWVVALVWCWVLEKCAK
jgi:hypothetical protein